MIRFETWAIPSTCWVPSSRWMTITWSKISTLLPFLMSLPVLFPTAPLGCSQINPDSTIPVRNGLLP